ncbi:MAG TPA: glycogen synthase GlgA [Usitatibacter sp.]|nr:glycogen synthase GlgA [Usitatibacter sp.]
MPPPHSPQPTPSVLFATPECAPLVKTGGLGDVSGALPAALVAEGIDARILLPGYVAVLEACEGAREVGSFEILGHSARLLESRLADGVPLLVLDIPKLYARRGTPYQADDGEDWEDNALRFGVFSKVAALLGTSESPLEWRPGVVHCNDWPLGLAPLYLHFAPGPKAASVITIHNLAFQGIFPWHHLDPLAIPEESRGMEGLEFHDRASFLKAGLMYADAITTVSPTYAREIQTEELGFGLDGVLRHRAERLHGVLNGIDTALWNPMADPHLVSRYGMLTLERKVANKRVLRKRFELGGSEELPLLAAVSRITHQKGIDVLAEAMPQLTALPAQVAVVGRGEREMVAMLRAAQAKNPANVGFIVAFDEPLAHLVEAGADVFLMPSRFEPCGMNQMYSQRYGTPPVAHATGGLVDTIVDDDGVRPDATGFLIPEAAADALVVGARRAVTAYRDARRWKALQTRGMTRDFGWGPAAREYARIYRAITPTS